MQWNKATEFGNRKPGLDSQFYHLSELCDILVILPLIFLGLRTPSSQRYTDLGGKKVCKNFFFIVWSHVSFPNWEFLEFLELQSVWYGVRVTCLVSGGLLS